MFFVFVFNYTFCFFFFFFFNDTATTEIYTLSLHDALPIFCCSAPGGIRTRDLRAVHPALYPTELQARGDRKSTRLNSSHVEISYAVFCLKKKKIKNKPKTRYINLFSLDH